MGTAVAADPRRQTMAENAMRGAVVLEAAQLKADEDAENRYTEAAWLKAEQDAAAAARVQEVHLAKEGAALKAQRINVMALNLLESSSGESDGDDVAATVDTSQTVPGKVEDAARTRAAEEIRAVALDLLESDEDAVVEEVLAEAVQQESTAEDLLKQAKTEDGAAQPKSPEDEATQLRAALKEQRMLMLAEGARIQEEAAKEEAARATQRKAQEMELQLQQEAAQLQAEVAELKAKETVRLKTEAEAEAETARLEAEAEAARLEAEAEAEAMAARLEAEAMAEAETARLKTEAEAAQLEVEAEAARLEAEKEVAQLKAEAAGAEAAWLKEEEAQLSAEEEEAASIRLQEEAEDLKTILAAEATRLGAEEDFRLEALGLLESSSESDSDSDEHEHAAKLAAEREEDAAEATGWEAVEAGALLKAEREHAAASRATSGDHIQSLVQSMLDSSDECSSGEDV